MPKGGRKKEEEEEEGRCQTEEEEEEVIRGLINFSGLPNKSDALASLPRKKKNREIIFSRFFFLFFLLRPRKNGRETVNNLLSVLFLPLYAEDAVCCIWEMSAAGRFLGAVYWSRKSGWGRKE